MRTVFDNHMVAHVWAQRTQETGRSHNGNFWFEGETIYSYRTPIARFITTKSATVALVTSETFSVTTSGKHMGPIRRALRDDMPTFYVPFIASRPNGCGYFRGKEYSAQEAAEANLKHIENRYYENRQRLLRSRDRQTWALDGLRASYSERVQFALLFEIDYTPRDVDADVAEITARWDRLEAKRNDPTYVAKRERERARKEQRELEKAAEAIEAWRRGELYSPFRGRHSYRNTPVVLRVRGENVETSRGASVPVHHAKRIWSAIKNCYLTQSTWQRNGHAMPIGHFQVDRIEADGTLIAGCHVIRFAELARLAVALGVEAEIISAR